MNRRALVTGACGCQGGHLLDQLVEDGWDVRATDLPEADRNRLPQEVSWAPADLNGKESLAPLVQGMDVVFHTAQVSDPATPWERLYRVNVLGTDRLLEAARNAGVHRIVNWSSYLVYGKPGRNRAAVDETRPARPADDVGRSVAMRDAVVWRYHDAGLPATLLRPSLVYGARGCGGLTDLVLRLNRLPAVPVPLANPQRVACVHVKDVARAASFVVEREETVGEEYNITDDGRHSLSAFVSLLARALGKPTVPVPAPIFLLRAGAWLAARRFRGRRGTPSRPLGLSRDLVYHFTFDFVPSNSKIKALDFRFLFPDPSAGIPETIQELRREGYLE